MNDYRSDDRRRDPEALEREIRQTRAEMNETMDTLERKLTAGQLLDQCLKFFGKTGTELGASLGNTAKENPVPMLLTVTGIAWMMFGRNQPYRGSNTTDFRDAYGFGGTEQSKGRERISRIREGISERTTNVADRVSEGVSAMGESLSEKASEMGDRIRNTAEATRSGLSRSAQSAREAVTDSVSTTANRAQTQLDRAREGFNSIVEEQPLVLGALGLAVGAVIGAMLPSTEPEDRLIGEMRDKTLAKAKEAGAVVYEKGRETATQTVEKIAQR